MCRRYRADAHVLGVYASVCIGYQTGQRFDAAGFGGAGFHQHHGSGSVIDARGIAGRHGAVFFDEDSLEFGHVVQRAVGAVVLVGVVGDFALAAFEHDRHDLRLEAPALDGALCALVAFNGQRVLVGPCDAPLRSNVLSRHAHMDGVKWVMQRAHHHVDHFAVAHARAKARGQAGIGCAAHIFSAATNGHVGIAQQDALAGRDDGLQARAAQAVDVEGRRAF